MKAMTPARLRVSQVWLVAILSLLALLVGAGCSREPQTSFRIGTNVWPGYEPLYLARELGYYPQGGIRLVEYSSSSDVITAFRNGAIDGAALTLDEVILLAETTPDLSVVLVLDVSNGADVILAQPTIATLRDLKGKQVGLETSALGAYVLSRALEMVGMTPSDMVLVSLEVSEHERAFKEGRIDAVVTFEPVRTKLLSVGARQLFDSSRIPGEIVDVLVVRRSAVQRREGRIEQLVCGWFNALGFIRKDPERAAALMAQREQVGSKEFQKAFEVLRLVDLDENRAMLSGAAPALPLTARKLGAVMLANGLIKQSLEPNRLFDGGFVRDAKP